MAIQVINNGRITRENQHFFLGNIELPGLQSVEMNYSINAKPIKHLGQNGTVNYVPAGAQVGDVSLSAYLISDDQIINYTGLNGVNGYLLQNQTNTGSNFSFTSGYLTSYVSKCAIGQIPQIDAQFKVLGNIGRINGSESQDVVNNFTYFQGNNSNLLLKVPGPGSININIDDFTTNRVNSYSLGITIDRHPFYILGQRNPNKVEINWPIQVEGKFQIEVNDYTPFTIKNYPMTLRSKNLTITISDYNTNNTISTFSFNNVKLMSEAYRMTENANAVIDITYKTFLNRN